MNVIKNEDNNSGADSLNAVLSVTEAVAVRSKKRMESRKCRKKDCR